METAANMALLWGRSYRADNVMDHCLDGVRGSGWGCCGGAGVQADRRGWWELVGGRGVKNREGCRREAETEGGAAGRVMHRQGALRTATVQLTCTSGIS